MRELFKLKQDKYEMVVEISELYSEKAEYSLALEALQKYMTMDTQLTLQQATHLTGLQVALLKQKPQKAMVAQVLLQVTSLTSHNEQEVESLSNLKNELVELQNGLV